MSRGSYVWSRDLWLARAVVRLRPVFEAAPTVPVPTQVTVQATQLEPLPGGAVPNGRCWPSSAMPDGSPGIAISEELDDPVQILSTLMHELVHAVDDCCHGHGLVFQQWATLVGLVPNPENCGTTAGPYLRRQLDGIAQGLGAYPSRVTGYVLSTAGGVLV